VSIGSSKDDAQMKLINAMSGTGPQDAASAFMRAVMRNAVANQVGDSGHSLFTRHTTHTPTRRPTHTPTRPPTHPCTPSSKITLTKVATHRPREWTDARPDGPQYELTRANHRYSAALGGTFEVDRHPHSPPPSVVTHERRAFT
jgi:hypothetical protein